MNNHFILIILGIFELINHVSENFLIFGLLVNESKSHHGTSMFIILWVGGLLRQIGLEKVHGLSGVVLMNDSEGGNQVEFGPMGRFGHPVELLMDEFVVGGSSVLERVGENDSRMGHGLFGVHFFFDLQDVIGVG